MTPPDKAEAKAIIQRAQDLLGELYTKYPDSSLEFYALWLAWEATRHAWYIVDHDFRSAIEKMGCVRKAWQRFEGVRAKQAELKREA